MIHQKRIFDCFFNTCHQLNFLTLIISYIDYDFIKFENQSHPTFINQTEEQSMK